MMLLGALLAKGRPQFELVRDDRYDSGYSVRFRMGLSHASLDFLEALERELMQQSISCTIRKTRHPNKSYSLNILKRKDLVRLAEWMRETKGAAIWLKVGKWQLFLEAIDIYKNGEHLTQEGLDKLMKMKGLI